MRQAANVGEASRLLSAEASRRRSDFDKKSSTESAPTASMGGSAKSSSKADNVAS